MAATKIEFTAAETKKMVKLYEDGWGLVAVAEEFGVSLPVARRTLIEAGTKIRPRGRQPQS